MRSVSVNSGSHLDFSRQLGVSGESSIARLVRSLGWSQISPSRGTPVAPFAPRPARAESRSTPRSQPKVDSQATANRERHDKRGHRQELEQKWRQAEQAGESRDETIQTMSLGLGVRSEAGGVHTSWWSVLTGGQPRPHCRQPIFRKLTQIPPALMVYDASPSGWSGLSASLATRSSPRPRPHQPEVSTFPPGSDQPEARLTLPEEDPSG